MVAAEQACHAQVLSAGETAGFSIGSIILIMGSGLMAGLTLGLMSMDELELNVLQRTGSPDERKRAAKLLPVIARPHWMLCTLVLINAACMEALPIFLDRLLDPVAAILISVTAILIFGEILPQAICSRYGIRIGAFFAPLVRVLMWVTVPITWPLGWVLDRTLGHDDSLFKRRELAAMVTLHQEGAGMGGTLSADEVNVISGALELTAKAAGAGMTPIDHVFMLSTDDVIDERMVDRILTQGHSRLPVYRGTDRSDIVGLILIKELLRFFRTDATPAVGDLRMRVLPRMPYDTAMFDMLNFFQTGRSHMAVLLGPPGMSLEAMRAARPKIYVDGDTSAHGGDGGSTHGGGGGGGGKDAHAGGGDEGKPHIALRMEGGGGGGSGRSNGSKDAAAAGSHHHASSSPPPPGAARQRSFLGRVSRMLTPRRHGSSTASGLSASGSAVSSDDGGGGGGGRRSGSGGGSGLVVEGADDAAGVRATTAEAAVLLAAQFVPVGIITLEDVIEELMQEEILDETDTHLDNEKRTKADRSQLLAQLPASLRVMLQASTKFEAAAVLARHSGKAIGSGIAGLSVTGLARPRSLDSSQQHMAARPASAMAGWSGPSAGALAAVPAAAAATAGGGGGGGAQHTAPVAVPAHHHHAHATGLLGAQQHHQHHSHPQQQHHHFLGGASPSGAGVAGAVMEDAREASDALTRSAPTSPARGGGASRSVTFVAPPAGVRVVRGWGHLSHELAAAPPPPKPPPPPQ